MDLVVCHIFGRVLIVDIDDQTDVLAGFVPPDGLIEDLNFQAEVDNLLQMAMATCAAICWHRPMRFRRRIFFDSPVDETK